MKLLVNDTEVVLQRGTSISYTIEHPMISNAEGYTLELSLPLIDCEQNQDIFGSVDLLANSLPTDGFPALLLFGNMQKSGELYVLSYEDGIIKAQFVDGVSSGNVNGSVFDTTYLNELSLKWPNLTRFATDRGVVYYSADQRGIDAYLAGDKEDGLGYFLTLGAGLIRNDNIDPLNTRRYYNRANFSMQIFMVGMVQMLLSQIGYSSDFTPWLNSQWRHLVCCNSLPHNKGVHDTAKLLPHWTMNELFAELEKLMGCRFIINHATKLVTMEFCNKFDADNVTNISNMSKLIYPLQDIVRTYTKETQDPDTTGFVYKILSFGDYGDKYGVYPLPLVSNAFVVRQFSLNELNNTGFSQNSTTGHANYNTIQVTTPEAFFILTNYGTNSGTGNTTHFFGDPKQIGYHFTPDKVYGRELEKQECKIVPYYPECIDFDNDDATQSTLYCEEAAQKLVEGDASEKAEEIYDKIFVGFYTGGNLTDNYINDPFTTNIKYDKNSYSYQSSGITLLRPTDNYIQRVQFMSVYDNTQKLTCEFFAPLVPDIRCRFHIKNQLYLCKQMRINFVAGQTPDEMGYLIKAEFYKIIQ